MFLIWKYATKINKVLLLKSNAKIAHSISFL